MTINEAVSLARAVIDKYGADADKPSVHLAKAVLDGAHERDYLRTRQAELEKERDAAVREADRWRHGITIEGDFVCPTALERDELKAACERMRAVLDAAAKVSQLRERQSRLGDVDYDQLDGQIGDALDDLDAVLTSKAGAE